MFLQGSLVSEKLFDLLPTGCHCSVDCSVEYLTSGKQPSTHTTSFQRLQDV